jgi:hypothetical protein
MSSFHIKSRFYIIRQSDFPEGKKIITFTANSYFFACSALSTTGEIYDLCRDIMYG